MHARRERPPGLSIGSIILALVALLVAFVAYAVPRSFITIDEGYLGFYYFGGRLLEQGFSL